jgi:hypothetical protein
MCAQLDAFVLAVRTLIDKSIFSCTSTYSRFLCPIGVRAMGFYSVQKFILVVASVSPCECFKVEIIQQDCYSVPRYLLGSAKGWIESC